jgi:hypothetical protein
MKCPECVKENTTSYVYPGMTSRTWPYYDEEGKMHNHDYNHSCTYYSCSNKHEWRQTYYCSCWCGWTNEPEKDNK